MENEGPLAIISKYFSDFSRRQLEQFSALDALYRDWNEKINVISRKDIDALYQNHVLHSLAIAAVADFQPGAEIVDIGTGGGFPGIPLAIFFPDVKFLLVDSIGKKIKVVQEVAAALELSNVEAIKSRVEDLEAGTFDYAVSRAVAPLADLWRWCLPLLRKGRSTPGFAHGLFCLKGGDLRTEIAATGRRPTVFPIMEIFEEEIFREKSVVYLPVRN